MRQFEFDSNSFDVLLSTLKDHSGAHASQHNESNLKALLSGMRKEFREHLQTEARRKDKEEEQELLAPKGKNNLQLEVSAKMKKRKGSAVEAELNYVMNGKALLELLPKAIPTDWIETDLFYWLDPDLEDQSARIA